MIQLQCKTTFDITATGVRSHFQPSRLPFVSNNNQLISTQTQWQHARNQQRNWETVNQIIALRCLPEHISIPVLHQHHWTFSFDIPDISAVSTADLKTGLLYQDAADVPMIVGLGEQTSGVTVLRPEVNIWFKVVE